MARAECLGISHSLRWARQARPAVNAKVQDTLWIKCALEFKCDWGQSPSPWQHAEAMLSVCIPLAFGEEKKCGEGLPGDLHHRPLVAPGWARAEPCPVQGLLDVAIGTGLVVSSRCFSWLSGIGSPWRGHAGDGEAVVWVVSQHQRALGSTFLCIKYASGHCIS